jgi:hypothetical protein
MKLLATGSLGVFAAVALIRRRCGDRIDDRDGQQWRYDRMQKLTDVFHIIAPNAPNAIVCWSATQTLSV